jgi:hypothetical protein
MGFTHLLPSSVTEEQLKAVRFCSGGKARTVTEVKKKRGIEMEVLFWRNEEWLEIATTLNADFN